MSKAKGVAGSSRFKFVCSYQEDHKKPLYGVSFNKYLVSAEKHLQTFAIAGTNRVSIYSCKGGSSTVTLLQAYVDDNPEEMFYAVAWSYQEAEGFPILAAGGDLGLIRLIRTDTCKNYMTLVGHGNAVNELKVSDHNLSLLVSASKDYSLRLWNMATGVCIAVLCGDKGHRDEVLSVDFNFDFSRVVSCGMDQAVKVWAVDSPAILEKIDAAAEYKPSEASRPFPTLTVSSPLLSTSSVHQNYVDCVRWYGDLLISKSTENKLVCWTYGGCPRLDLPEQRRKYLGSPVTILCELDLPNCEIWYVRFSICPNHRFVACGNQAGKVYVWDMDRVEESTEAKQVLVHPKAFPAVRQTAFSPDGRYLVCVCDDGSFCLWDSSKK